MKISAKGRYGLAAMTFIAQRHTSGEPITVMQIAAKLGISKIYLEQVFSLLKRAGLVVSTKGAQGGYQLAQSPETTTAYQVLRAIELSLVEKTEPTAAAKAPGIDAALNAVVFDAIDAALRQTLAAVTLADIAAQAEAAASGTDYMYFI